MASRRSSSVQGSRSLVPTPPPGMRDAVTLCVVCRLSDSGFQSPTPAPADLPFRMLMWIDIYRSGFAPGSPCGRLSRRHYRMLSKRCPIRSPPHEASRADANPLQAVFGLSSGVCGISDTVIIVRTPISLEFRAVSPLTPWSTIREQSLVDPPRGGPIFVVRKRPSR